MIVERQDWIVNATFEPALAWLAAPAGLAAGGGDSLSTTHFKM